MAMGGHSDGRRRFAGFIGLAFGVILLFGAVAMAALRPTDGLAWVDVPQLAPDLGLDAGLRTQPLKAAVVADALRDSALEGSAAESLAVAVCFANHDEKLRDPVLVFDVHQTGRADRVPTGSFVDRERGRGRFVEKSACVEHRVDVGKSARTRQ
jgi:hypothetical protein